MNKLQKDMDFIIELDKMKSIYRMTSLIGKDIREDDAQHSWHITIMAVILQEYANEEINILKVMKMLLIHDLVEIYAGDTFCYDEVGYLDKFERESKAAEKIFGILDEEKGNEFKALWLEFEEMETKDALFAASMDRIQPMLNNYYNDGGTWKKHKISKDKIYKRAEPIKESSDKIWAYTEGLIKSAIDKGYVVEE